MQIDPISPITSAYNTYKGYKDNKPKIKIDIEDGVERSIHIISPGKSEARKSKSLPSIRIINIGKVPISIEKIELILEDETIYNLSRKDLPKLLRKYGETHKINFDSNKIKKEIGEKKSKGNISY